MSTICYMSVICLFQIPPQEVVVVFGYIEGPFFGKQNWMCARIPCTMYRRVISGKQKGGRGLGYMLFNAHLCNQPCSCKSGGGTWGTALYTVRGVGSESRDVDAWTQTFLYTEDRGLPSTDDPGASPVRLSHTGTDPQVLSCHVRPDVSLTSADVRPQVT